MYASAVMPNNFAHPLAHASMQQGMDSKDSIQGQQQQQQQQHQHQHQHQHQQHANNQANMFKTPQDWAPQAEALNAAFDVNSHFYNNHDIWMTGLLDQNFVTNEFQDTY
jgi:hypothetical protein